MKKPLKCAISALLSAIFLLTACSAPSAPSLPSELVSPPTKNIYPVTLHLVSPSFFKYNDADNSVEVKKAWLEEMYTRYNVRMDIISDSPSEEGDPYGKEATLLQKNILNGTASYAGAVEINSYAQLRQAIIDQKVLILDDYVYEHSIWSALPSGIKRMFWIGRHVYAIAASSTPILKVRSFTDDSLYKTRIDVTDLESLKEYAIALKQQKGGYAISSDGLANLGDILNAFGLYIDETDNGPFGLEPNVGYVDFLTKDTAVDALKYLRELYNAGVLKINFGDSIDTAFSDFKNGVCASYYGEYHDYDDCTEVLTLNPAYPRSITTSVSGYFLTNETEQPRETVNFLLQMLLASQENYLESRLGSPENYTIGSSGTVTVKKFHNSNGHDVLPAMPNLVQDLPEAFLSSNANILYTSTATTGVTTTRSEYQQMIDNGIEKGTIAPLRMEYSKPNSYYAVEEYILKFYNTCISDAITDNSKSVEDVIATYKANMFKLGGNDILKDMGSGKLYNYGSFTSAD